MWSRDYEIKALRQAWIESLSQDYYSVEEAAKILKRSKQAVYDMTETGELRVSEVGENHYKRTPKAELARVLTDPLMSERLGEAMFGGSKKTRKISKRVRTDTPPRELPGTPENSQASDKQCEP